MFVRRKLINGRWRHYAVWSYRENGKVKQRQIYLGACKTVAHRILQMESKLKSRQEHLEYCGEKMRLRFGKPYWLNEYQRTVLAKHNLLASLERLNALAKFYGLLPTDEEREAVAAAARKRSEAIRMSFVNWMRREGVVFTPTPKQPEPTDQAEQPVLPTVPVAQREL